MVLRKASSFMCATISTAQVTASVATQVTRPEASNLGWNSSPSSMSWIAGDEFGTTLSLHQNKHSLSATAAHSLARPTRVYPSWASQIVEVGYIRLRVGEGWGEAYALSIVRNPSPGFFASRKI